LTRQPADKRESSAAAAKATTMAMAMATGDTARCHHGYLAATALVLATEVVAVLIADRRIAGNFDCHGDAAVQRGAHCLIEHVQGFTWSH
jgi:hypothetical protein